MREVQIVTRDDFDGTPGASTYEFGWNGKQYEIDLSDDHHKVLDDLLSKYVGVARPITTTGKSKTPTATAAGRPSYSTYKARRAALARVREWATAEGIATPPRARVPRAVHDAYNNAHPDDQIMADDPFSYGKVE